PTPTDRRLPASRCRPTPRPNGVASPLAHGLRRRESSDQSTRSRTEQCLHSDLRILRRQRSHRLLISARREVNLHLPEDVEDRGASTMAPRGSVIDADGHVVESAARFVEYGWSGDDTGNPAVDMMLHRSDELTRSGLCSDTSPWDPDARLRDMDR